MYFTINQTIIGRFSRSLYVGSKIEYLFAVILPFKQWKLFAEIGYEVFYSRYLVIIVNPIKDYE